MSARTKPPWWPACRVRFYSSPEAMEAGAWRQCVLWWGHEVIRRTPHRGPLMVLPAEPTTADLMATEAEHRPGRHRT